MLINTFARQIPTFFRAGHALEIVSGPGVGKSSVMEQGAAAMSKLTGKPFGIVTQILSQMDPVDIKGMGVPMKDPENPKKVDVRFTAPSIFPAEWNVEVYVEGELDPDYKGIPDQGILFLDEFGQSGPETQKVAAQLLLSKRIAEYKLPKGWVVWCASNRLSDKSGVNKRLSFVQNRVMTVEIKPDYLAWEEWAHKAAVHPLAVTFAKKHPSKVFRDSVPAEPGPYCTPRSLVLCTQMLEAMRTEAHGDMRLPDDEVALEVMSGWLGEGTAIDFATHVRLANDLPEMDQVAKKPKETKIPERPDARFVMASMLAHHAKPETVGAFITYLQRMDVEMQVLFVNAVIRRCNVLMARPEVATWIAANRDLLQAAY